MRASRWAVVLALGVSLGALADGRVEAKKRFKAGMALISEGHVDEGVAALLEAYSIRPHPNVLFNIAKAYDSAGRAPEALTYYQRYLATNPPDSEKVRAVASKLEAQVSVAPAVVDAGVVVAVPADGAALAKLEALTERLERAVSKAEVVPERAVQEAPVVVEEDFGVPYEETVVAASRRAQSTLEAPNATTIISAEEIRASGLTSLPELLRRVPGAEVMTMGVASANVSMRGFNQRIANKVLLLIDGRPEYQDFLGLTLWPVVPIGVEEIERIEVIRGPGSALYGANAMLGVINIITRAPGTGSKAEFTGAAGNGNLAQGSFVASGGSKLRYRASVGYQQAEKYTRDFAPSRTDVTANVSDANLGLRSARANLTAYYAFDRDWSLAASAGVNRLLTEVYAIGLLRNYFVDGTGGFAKLDVTGGPVKLRLFWNHLDATTGPQYEPAGQRSLVTTLESNTFDGELLFQKAFELGGTHLIGVGASARLKRLSWGYLAGFTQELHGAAFVQDEWRIAKPFSVVASYRVDRHPLLDQGNPGYAQSPRVSALYTAMEGHALRASFATAFRAPTFLESYMDIRTPVPGVNGASVLTQGNRALRPERLISFEVGYRGELARLGLSWDLALYWNVVNDLIVLSAVNPVPVGEAYDSVSQSFLLGRSLFTNDPGSYTARGFELGGTWTAARGLDLRGSVALQSVVSNEKVAVCGPCSQAPVAKLNAGVIYRTTANLDFSADVSFVSGTTWVEREPSASDPTVIDNVRNPLGAYAVVNARVAYRALNDHLTVALVGTQLGPAHQEHPFGNRVGQRVFAQVTVTP